MSRRPAEGHRAVPALRETEPTAWGTLDPCAATGVAAGLVDRVAVVVQAFDRAGRRELAAAEEVALVQATLELANRLMSLHIRAARAVFDRHLLDTRGDEEKADRWAGAELAPACGVSEYQMSTTLYVAEALTLKLPRVRAAFADGRLDWSKVRTFAHAVLGVSPEHAAHLEALVLPLAPKLTTSKLRAALEEARVVVTGEDAQRRARQAREGRGVVFRQLSDTMAELVALLPAEDAAMVQNALHRTADASTTEDDDRTADQRRADTLVDLVVDAAQDAFESTVPAPHPGPRPTPGAQEQVNDPVRGASPSDTRTVAAEALSASRPSGRRRGRSGRTRPLHAIITVPLSTVLDLADDPGTLVGHGPIPAAIVRDLLTNATWQCCAEDDEHGTLLGLGRSTFTPAYRPGSPLSDHIEQRDITCRFPGCSRSAGSCEIDHLVPPPRGDTCECNVGALCPHHHRVKHEAGWRVMPSDDPGHPVGSLVWVSPNGLRHVWLAPALTPAPRFARARGAALAAELRAQALTRARMNKGPAPF